MKCPRCGSEEYCKDGIVKGRQRFKCKQCNYHYSVEKKSNVKSQETKRLAFEMYLEGLGFRAIGRILKISHVTVFQWVKKWGATLELPKREEAIEVVELDEMHTYVSHKKNYKWIWIAVDYWESYANFVPAGKHLQTKAETYTVEGYNSRIRHYLARFKRKDKCYSKAEYMIVISLNLLMLKLNNELSI